MKTLLRSAVILAVVLAASSSRAQDAQLDALLARFRSVQGMECRFHEEKRIALLTTPIVSAPASRAISAMTGAAPVPVPPPSPAVMNTMSAPRTISSISS